MLADETTHRWIQRKLRERVVPPLRPRELEDVLQEALVRAWQLQTEFNPHRGTISQWYYGICLHVALEFCRSPWAQQRCLEHQWKDSARNALAKNRADEVGGRMQEASVRMCQRLRQAIDRLPAREKEVILEDLRTPGCQASARAVGTRLGIRPSTVRVYRMRAHAHLRAELSADGSHR